MPTDIIMPQMGESIVEGTITKWLKKPGDKIQRDEPLFEISTDKVDAEIPAPASGVLQEIKVAEGTTVNVNTVVGTIAVDGEAAAKPAPAPEKPATKSEGKKTEEKKAVPAPPPVAATAAHEGDEEARSSLSSVKSPANTASGSPKSPAPDLVAASLNRTSCSSSRARDLRKRLPLLLPPLLSLRPALPRRVP